MTTNTVSSSPFSQRFWEYQDMPELVFSFFGPRELVLGARVSTQFRRISEARELWNRWLQPKASIILTERNLIDREIKVKKIFLSYPFLRECFIFFDHSGNEYLLRTIKDLYNMDVSLALHSFFLKTNPTATQIQNLFKRLNTEKCPDTHSWFLGIRAGLSFEQVTREWFTKGHALAAEQGIPYGEYSGVSDEDAYLVCARIIRPDFSMSVLRNNQPKYRALLIEFLVKFTRITIDDLREFSKSQLILLFERRDRLTYEDFDKIKSLSDEMACVLYENSSASIQDALDMKDPSQLQFLILNRELAAWFA